MREDMFKVIVERPRRGSHSIPRVRSRLAGEDDLPTKIGVRRHVTITHNRTKSLNENLNPLKRYLAKQVGRPWDDVYSEMCATLAPGHVVQEHVRQHLDDFVARKISIGRDGEWLAWNGRYFGPRSSPWHQPFYVDPIDGVLKDSAKLWAAKKIAVKNWRWRRPEPDPNIRPIAEMRELQRIDGIWYEITFHRDEESLAWVYDLIQRTLVPANIRHANAKRQLPRSELLAFGLANDNT